MYELYSNRIYLIWGNWVIWLKLVIFMKTEPCTMQIEDAMNNTERRNIKFGENGKFGIIG